MFKSEYLSTIIIKVSIIGTNLVTTMILSRYLGPTLKGELAYLTNIVNILAIVCSFGLEQSFGYLKKNNYKNGDKKFIKFIIVFDIILILLAILFYVSFFSNIYYKYILVLSLLNIVVNQIAYITMIESVIKRNRIIVIGNITYVVLILLAFIFSKASLIYPILALVVKLIVEISAYFFVNIKLIDLCVRLDKDFLKKIFFIGMPAMIMTLLLTFNYNLDVLILKNYVTYADLGLYTAGVSIANLAWVFSDSFKEVLFSKTTNGDQIDEIIFVIKINLILSVFMIVGFAIFGKVLISIIHGRSFLNSYKVTTIILFGTVPMAIFKMINTLYINRGEQLKSTIILAISLVLNVMFNNILIPYLGINGAAISTVISYYACGLILIKDFSKRYNIKFKQYISFTEKDFSRINIMNNK